MKVRCMKSGKTITWVKETTFESVLCDCFSIFVLLIIFAINLLLSKMFGRSWVIDIFTVFIFIAYVVQGMNTKEITHEEAVEEINKMLEERKDC